MPRGEGRQVCLSSSSSSSDEAKVKSASNKHRTSSLNDPDSLSFDEDSQQISPGEFPKQRVFSTGKKKKKKKKNINDAKRSDDAGPSSLRDDRQSSSVLEQSQSSQLSLTKVNGLSRKDKNNRHKHQLQDDSLSFHGDSQLSLDEIEEQESLPRGPFALTASSRNNKINSRRRSKKPSLRTAVRITAGSSIGRTYSPSTTSSYSSKPEKKRERKDRNNDDNPQESVQRHNDGKQLDSFQQETAVVKQGQESSGNRESAKGGRTKVSTLSKSRKKLSAAAAIQRDQADYAMTVKEKSQTRQSTTATESLSPVVGATDAKGTTHRSSPKQKSTARKKHDEARVRNPLPGTKASSSRSPVMMEARSMLELLGSQDEATERDESQPEHDGSMHSRQDQRAGNKALPRNDNITTRARTQSGSEGKVLSDRRRRTQEKWSFSLKDTSSEDDDEDSDSDSSSLYGIARRKVHTKSTAKRSSDSNNKEHPQGGAKKAGRPAEEESSSESDVSEKYHQRPYDILKVGDSVSYYHPVFVAGDPQGYRETVITAIKDMPLEADSQVEYFPLELENGDVLPASTRIKRLMTGRQRAIEDFVLLEDNNNTGARKRPTALQRRKAERMKTAMESMRHAVSVIPKHLQSLDNLPSSSEGEDASEVDKPWPRSSRKRPRKTVKVARTDADMSTSDDCSGAKQANYSRQKRKTGPRSTDKKTAPVGRPKVVGIRKQDEEEEEEEEEEVVLIPSPGPRSRNVRGEPISSSRHRKVQSNKSRSASRKKTKLDGRLDAQISLESTESESNCHNNTAQRSLGASSRKKLDFTQTRENKLPRKITPDEKLISLPSNREKPAKTDRRGPILSTKLPPKQPNADKDKSCDRVDLSGETKQERAPRRRSANSLSSCSSFSEHREKLKCYDEEAPLPDSGNMKREIPPHREVTVPSKSALEDRLWQDDDESDNCFTNEIAGRVDSEDEDVAQHIPVRRETPKHPKATTLTQRQPPVDLCDSDDDDKATFFGEQRKRKSSYGVRDEAKRRMKALPSHVPADDIDVYELDGESSDIEISSVRHVSMQAALSKRRGPRSTQKETTRKQGKTSRSKLDSSVFNPNQLETENDHIYGKIESDESSDDLYGRRHGLLRRRDEITEPDPKTKTQSRSASTGKKARNSRVSHKTVSRQGSKRFSVESNNKKAGGAMQLEIRPVSRRSLLDDDSDASF